MSRWEPYEVIWYTVVITVCLIFMGWIGTALIRWANEPYYPPQPTPQEIAAQACKDKGGIPKMKWVDREGYAPTEMFDVCEGVK